MRDSTPGFKSSVGAIYNMSLLRSFLTWADIHCYKDNAPTELLPDSFQYIAHAENFAKYPADSLLFQYR